MKLAETLKAGVTAEVVLSTGERLLIGGAGETHKIEKADDAEQVLTLLTVVTTGRQKGNKARVLVPYVSIGSVVVVM